MLLYWSKQTLVFTTRTGKPLNLNNCLKLFRQAAPKSGLKAITFHDLRNTHATILLRQGINPKRGNESCSKICYNKIK
ncbi:tyrosine-type recombinase/integrase [Neomoorella thermoacetica]|uniref:tyrosine-type recombinase/integrase n=1 Tax=Neomoorella thermoacetica TaxID=1525 RepID=UPI0009B94AAF|nr:tyrosine-type recombinase/integrase [Moorella thermoacetica]